MTFLVTDNCIKCKHMDCVTVCPVDCFYEGENMLVINPEECIDCGVCVDECPPGAIVEDTEDNTWFELNDKWAQIWPRITEKRDEDVPPDAEQWHNVENKYKLYFSEKPGKGD